MTLINYIYPPKSIQKVNRGVLSLYKGVLLNEESALNEVVRYITTANVKSLILCHLFHSMHTAPNGITYICLLIFSLNLQCKTCKIKSMACRSGIKKFFLPPFHSLLWVSLKSVFVIDGAVVSAPSELPEFFIQKCTEIAKKITKAGNFLANK